MRAAALYDIHWYLPALEWTIAFCSGPLHTSPSRTCWPLSSETLPEARLFADQGRLDNNGVFAFLSTSIST